MGLKHISKASGSQKLLVLMVSTFLPDRDGIASYASRLVNALTKENIMPISAANGREWKRNSPLYIFSIMRRAIASKTRIVHVQLSYFTFGNEYYTGIFPLLLFSLKLIGKNVVLTFHDIVPKSKVTEDFLKDYTGKRLLRLKKWALIYFTRIVCLAVDRIIVHSEIAKNVLVQDYGAPASKTNVIPHGIDQLLLSVDNVEGESKSLVSEGYRLVSYFGLVRHGKGLEDLVRAWKKAEIMNAKLFIIGGKHPILRDNCQENLTRLIKELELESSIKFCGYITSDALPEYFAKSDAFVFPYNQWGDVIASSGALSVVAPYRKPIVATDVPAFSDLKKIGGAIIVGRGDIDGLALAITKILTDIPIRKSLVVKLTEWVDDMSWSNVGKKTVALYHEVA